MTPLSLNALEGDSTDNFTPLSLKLPKPLELTVDGEKLFAWDVIGYGVILQFQVGYNRWVGDQKPYAEALLLAEDNIRACDLVIEHLEEVTETLKIDRERAYMVLEAERAAIKSQSVKGKLKVALWIAGALVVGAGAGILIGVAID